MLRIQLRGDLYAHLFGDGHQFLVRLAVVGHHHLAELLHFGVGRPPGRQLAELDLEQSADGGLLD
jgi:hypothetical protein